MQSDSHHQRDCHAVLEGGLELGVVAPLPLLGPDFGLMNRRNDGALALADGRLAMFTGSLGGLNCCGSVGCVASLTRMPLSCSVDFASVAQLVGSDVAPGGSTSSVKVVPAALGLRVEPGS